MNYEERLANLRRHIDGGTLVRKEWGDGHKCACIVGAMSPEATRAQDPDACPDGAMAAWLARLALWMNDYGTLEAWPQMVERFYSVATRWRVLDDAGWERARIGSLIVIVSHARKSCPAGEAETLAAIDGVLDWLRRGAPEDERANVRSAAESAEWAAAARAKWAAAAAAAAPTAAEWAAAKSAAARAARAAESAAAEWAAARAAAEWAPRAAVDEITSGILAAIEEECTKKENLPWPSPTNPQES